MSHPYCYWGPTCQLEPFFTMKSKKQPVLACPIDAIRVSACPMVAFSGFYESPRPPPLGDACDIVPPHCNDHQNDQQSGYIINRRFVCCRPGGRRGDTERVVAQWRRPVAFMKALVMLHWAMCSVLHRRTAMAIKMACNGGVFVRHRCLFRLL